jgi:hypothetical protein
MIKKILILSNQHPLAFINSPRKEFANLDVSDGISIHNKLTAAAWCGRDLPHIISIVNNNISVNLDVSDGISIHNKLTAAVWCDRDLPQTISIVNNNILFTEMKVTANKQNAAMTRVEQVDLEKMFVIFKQQIKTLATTDVDPSQHPMKLWVKKAFNFTVRP